jgi:hypothetical protein
LSTPKIDDFQRRGDRLVQGLGRDLSRALMRFEDPEGAHKIFLSEVASLRRDMDSFVKLNPHAKAWADALHAHLLKHGRELLLRAKNAAGHRGLVGGGLQGKYNNMVGGALGDAAGQTRQALHGQVEGLVRKLVDASVPSKVPGDVRGTITRELTRWLESEEFVEDAYFVVENTVGELATWLHARLTIQGEIELTRDTLVKNPKVPKAQAEAADQRVGELAKRAKALDEQIARRIEQATLKVKGRFSFRPALVLDPSKRFVKNLELRTGIQISQHGVQVDLGTKLKVFDPFTNPTFQAGAHVTTSIPESNLQFGAEATATGGSKGKVEDYTVRAFLKWRF